LTADGTCKPAACQSVKANSPGRRSSIRLVSGTKKQSSEGCGAWTTMAGRTLTLVRSENGYRTRTTSPREQVGIDVRTGTLLPKVPISQSGTHLMMERVPDKILRMRELASAETGLWCRNNLLRSCQKTAPPPRVSGKGAMFVSGPRTLDMGGVVLESGLSSPRSNSSGQSSVVSGQPAEADDQSRTDTCEGGSTVTSKHLSPD